MKLNAVEIYDIVNGAIDTAVTCDKYQLNFYQFLKSSQAKRTEVISFLASFLVSQIRDEISHLDLYLIDSPADLKEVYGWMGKPRVRKYKEYLIKIIEDAEKYECEKRPGRKPGSKNKEKRETTITNK